MSEILAIDDEVNILELLKLYLVREGYKVQTATTGKEALSKIESINFDLIVLDVMLPDIDGFELCRQIRRKSNIPILMLTARKDDIDKIIGLELGADDYMTKPFNPREMVARVKAIFRRCNTSFQPVDVINIGKLRIDIPRQEVTIDGQLIKLRTKELALLSTLAQNAGIVMSREKLLEKVWGFDYYGETRTIDVHINHLREKITASGVNIETLRGTGYKLVELSEEEQKKTLSSYC
jgi:two-component system, OmpR family, alkaline phosphatase synthesis response regulator PhoP